MLQAFVITLREGLEAFLIVAISLAYLRKSGRAELVPAVRWGIALSVLISIGGAMLFQRAANHALWEGILCIAAAVSVASNIAEGQGRLTKGEFRQFLGQARGSILELETQLAIACELGYLMEAKYQSLDTHSFQVLGLLNRLIESLSVRSAPAKP